MSRGLTIAQQRKLQISGRSLARTVIPNSGVAHWTFDSADTDSGTAIDSWGSYDGAINSATPGASGANQTYITNEAYTFDRLDDYISIGADSALSPNRISVALWINPDNVADRQLIISKDSQSSREWGLQLAGAAGDGGLMFDVHPGDGATSEPGEISAGTWYHITGTYDGSAMRIYINGAEVAVSNESISPNTGSADMRIGAREYTDSENYFGGGIDDPRLYNKALRSTEISNLYNTGSISG